MRMQEEKTRKPKRIKKVKRKQGHKIVWITLILIAIPIVFVLYVVATSAIGGDRPVEGNRFQDGDLDPKITTENVAEVQTKVAKIDGVSDATVTLESATLRVNLDCADDADQATINQITEEAYSEVNKLLPIETYFTNTSKGKMYDLEVDGYNYVVDNSHPQSGQIYIKITKTAPGKKTTDVLTTPKDQELVNEITR